MSLLLDVDVGGGIRHSGVTLEWQSGQFCLFWDKVAFGFYVFKCLVE